jgi:hypothetical protein
MRSLDSLTYGEEISVNGVLLDACTFEIELIKLGIRSNVLSSIPRVELKSFFHGFYLYYSSFDPTLRITCVRLSR